MWTEIKTDKDVAKFMKDTGCLHDSVIVSVNYESGCKNNGDRQIIHTNAENYKLLLTVDSSWYGRIEMLFEGVRHFRFGTYCDIYSNEIYSCYLEIRTDLLGKTRDDKLIVWSDFGDFEPVWNSSCVDLNKGDASVIIADSLKYRLINKLESKRLGDYI
ncbi:MAG: hypothetical protein K2O36_00350 [Ruminococcus sp.]|nr:hypothetical protein [Ruminococcus sp.]